MRTQAQEVREAPDAEATMTPSIPGMREATPNIPGNRESTLSEIIPGNHEEWSLDTLDYMSLDDRDPLYAVREDLRRRYDRGTDDQERSLIRSRWLEGISDERYQEVLRDMEDLCPIDHERQNTYYNYSDFE